MTARRVVWRDGRLMLLRRVSSDFRAPLYFAEPDPDPPLDLYDLRLPADMIQAIEKLAKARASDAGSPAVERARATLARYAAAHQSKAAGTAKGTQATRLSDADFLRAHELITEMAERDPDLSLTILRRRTAAALGCSPRTLDSDRANVRPVPRPKKK